MSRSLTLLVLAGVTACGSARAADAGTPPEHERPPSGATLASVAAAGSDTIPHHPRSTRTERMEFTGGNSTREYRLQFPAGSEGVSFRFDLRVDEGTVLWFLIDPAGEVRWSGRKDADADPDQIRGDIDGPAGDWKLVIDMRHADGRYALDWETRRPDR